MPCGAAVALDEVDRRLGKLLSEAIVGWHRSGWLIKEDAKMGHSANRLAGRHAKSLCRQREYLQRSLKRLNKLELRKKVVMVLPQYNRFHHKTALEAAGARKYGGKIQRNCQVGGITRLPSGNWRLTAGDAIFESEIIANSAGFWANDEAEMVTNPVPITKMVHQYLFTDTMPEINALRRELPLIRDCDSRSYLHQRGKGLRLGPWEKDCRQPWKTSMIRRRGRLVRSNSGMTGTIWAMGLA